MQDYAYTLAAGETRRFSVVGNTLRHKTGTGAVDVQANGGTVSLMPGQQITDTAKRFSEFSIKNNGAGTVSGVMIAGDVDFKDDQFTGNVAVTNMPAVNGAFVTTVKTIATVDGQMMAENSARRYLLIQNRHASSTIVVKFGAGAVSMTTGVKIAPGGTYEITGYVPTNEVRAICDGGGNGSVTVVEG